MLCRDSSFNVCVGFPFKDKGGWRLAGVIALAGKPRVSKTQRKKCPSGTGRRVEPENFARKNFLTGSLAASLIRSPKGTIYS